jgi:hypothetical protein
MKQNFFLRLVLLCLSVSVLSSVGFAQTERTLRGFIDNNTPYVELAFSVARSNSRIVLDMIPTSGDLDTLLYLVDSAGNIIDQNDDRVRGDVSSLIQFPSAPSGQYRAIATRYGVKNGDTSGDFELKVTVIPPSKEAPLQYDVSPEAIRASGFPDIAVRPRAEWTILAYYGGDTDLETGVLNDFKEFERAGGSNDTVRIVMLMDRYPGLNTTSGNWNSSKVFEVGDSNNDDELDSVEIADLGVDFSSGDGKLLAQYLVWAIRHFPANNYAVAFASHGAAWEGIIQDDTPAEGDNVAPDGRARKLTLEELNQAFTVATQEAGSRFSLLVNDACLMSSVEYYAVMANFFDTSFASPEVVIDPALNMTDFASILTNNPNVSALDLGQSLIDRYIDVDIRKVNSPDLVYLTQSITDLTRFDPVTTAVERFAQVFNSNPQRYAVALGNARKNTYTYSHFLGSQTKVDLGDLMRRLVAETNDVDLRTAAVRVLEAMDAARLYQRSGGDGRLERASYYNIYFPETADFFRSNAYFGATPLNEWATMLRNYYNAVTPKVWAGDTGDAFHAPVAPQVTITGRYPLENGSASLNSPVLAYVEVVGRNIATIDGTVDQLQSDGSFIRLSRERLLVDAVDENGNFVRQNDWKPGVNLLEISWDVALPVVTDGNTSVNELLIFTENVAFMEGYYRPTINDQWRDVTVVFNVVRYAGEVGRVQRVISRAANSEAAGNIEIPPGADFVAFRQRVKPDGATTLELSPNYMKWPPGGITYSWQAAPNGTYTYGVLATAFGGTTGYGNYSVQVDNTGADINLRGLSKPDLGYTVVRPAQWTFPLAYSLGQLEPLAVEFNRTTSPDGTINERGEPNADGSQNISIYYISEFDNNMEPVPNDLPFIAELLAELAGFTVEGDYTPITIAGSEGLEFSYSYSTANGVYRGRAVATHNAYFELGIVFAAEVREGSGADLETTVRLLEDNLRLFDNGEFLSARTRNWRLAFRESFLFARPSTWGESAREGWTAFSAGADPASPNFFAYREAEGTTSALADAVNGLANATVSDVRAYTNLSAWDAVTYNGTRGGTNVRGRVYTQERNGKTYTVWVEVEDTPEGLEVLQSLIETMVDSIEFYE